MAIPKETVKTCKHHGETIYILEGRGTYRCRKCRSANVSNRRRKVKKILVEEAGGKCRVCGYNKCVHALDFHHVDPATKEFHISKAGNTRGIETLRKEAAKCILLCSNCHRELENRVISLAGIIIGNELDC